MDFDEDLKAVGNWEYPWLPMDWNSCFATVDSSAWNGDFDLGGNTSHSLLFPTYFCVKALLSFEIRLLIFDCIPFRYPGIVYLL